MAGLDHIRIYMYICIYIFLYMYILYTHIQMWSACGWWLCSELMLHVCDLNACGMELPRTGVP